MSVWAQPSYASAVAGSTVVNIARTTSVDDGGQAIASNPAATVVGELLDIVLQTNAVAAAVAFGTTAATPFTIRNAGNGSEAFQLNGTVGGAPAVFVGFALDTDGSGTFDPAIDVPLADGASTPALAPGATQALLALVRTEAPVEGGTLAITARAATGSGRTGTVYAGRGDGGSDAVVGPTTAAASLVLPLRVALDTADATLVKSQSVATPSDGSGPLPGAIITYSIEARFTGTGPMRSARIVDPLPEGTEFVAASLRLDGVALTDASDGDAGTRDGAAVSFALGDVTGGATRTVSFQVKIK